MRLLGHKGLIEVVVLPAVSQEQASVQQPGPRQAFAVFEVDAAADDLAPARVEGLVDGLEVHLRAEALVELVRQRKGSRVAGDVAGVALGVEQAVPILRLQPRAVLDPHPLIHVEPVLGREALA